jgi:hypothetical protein
MKTRLIWCAVLMLVLCSGFANALEVEGVKLDDSITLNDGQPRLVLNGAGVRHKMAIIKVYVGALYLTAKMTDADKIISDPGPKRVAMHILADEVTAKDLTASLNHALAANHIPIALALIESRIRDLNRMMNSIGVIKKGGVIYLDYLPGTGTRITVNGAEKITIKGEEFFQALLRIWIGKKPVDGGLRNAMLGNGGGFKLF